MQWRLPEFPTPVGRQEVAAAVHKVREVLPPPTQLAYYGGLGLVAVFGIVELPVVAMAAAGMIVVQWTIRHHHEHETQPPAPVSEEPEKPAKPGKPAE
ncbi:hypothetical protein [Kutzneria buriramensis]|uniref:hypothetical protein n=1 Tax=Kutzneria buriramensis TaxID=1045776 RepID=UPI000E223F11|nr:hypothetical protein [Kutzneria buriramensis]